MGTIQNNSIYTSSQNSTVYESRKSAVSQFAQNQNNSEKDVLQTQDLSRGVTQTAIASNVGTYVMVNGKSTFVSGNSKSSDPQNTSATLKKKDGVDIKNREYVGFTASSYSLGGINFLTKGERGLTLNSVGKGLAPDSVNAIDAELNDIDISSDSQQDSQTISEKAEQIFWIGADMSAYYKKHVVNFQGNNLLSKVNGLYGGTAANAYSKTKDDFSCIS